MKKPNPKVEHFRYADIYLFNNSIRSKYISRVIRGLSNFKSRNSRSWKIRHSVLLDKLCLCQYLSCSFDRLCEIYRTSTTLTFLHLLFESIWCHTFKYRYWCYCYCHNCIFLERLAPLGRKDNKNFSISVNLHVQNVVLHRFLLYSMFIGVIFWNMFHWWIFKTSIFGNRP